MTADPRAELVTEIRRYVGILEEPENSGPWVEKFQRAAGGPAKGEPWCMALVIYAIQQVDLRLGCKSWIVPSESVLSVWSRSPLAARISWPEVGCIAMWRHFDMLGRPTAQGHAGVIVDVFSVVSYLTVEGNTGSGSKVIREGDGVYERHRVASFRGEMRTLGYLRPWDLSTPALPAPSLGAVPK